RLRIGYGRCDLGHNRLRISDRCDLGHNRLRISDRCDLGRNRLRISDRCDLGHNRFRIGDRCDLVNGDRLGCNYCFDDRRWRGGLSDRRLLDSWGGAVCRTLVGRLGLFCLGLGGFGELCRVLRLNVTPQTLAVGLAPGPICVGLHHAGGMALHPDTQGDA
ncbi:MAG: hypothetical protein ACJA0A_000452, partial [Acidimicrobiales bacterium]